MSITAAQNFRQHINRTPSLQAEVERSFNQGAIDFHSLAALGSRSGFDFTAEEAQQVLTAANDELSDFEMEMVSGGFTQPPQTKSGYTPLPRG